MRQALMIDFVIPPKAHQISLHFVREDLFIQKNPTIELSGFIQAKIFNKTVNEIEKDKGICFKFCDLYCSVVCES